VATVVAGDVLGQMTMALYSSYYIRGTSRGEHINTCATPSRTEYTVPSGRTASSHAESW